MVLYDQAFTTWAISVYNFKWSRDWLMIDHIDDVSLEQVMEWMYQNPCFVANSIRQSEGNFTGSAKAIRWYWGVGGYLYGPGRQAFWDVQGLACVVSWHVATCSCQTHFSTTWAWCWAGYKTHHPKLWFTQMNYKSLLIWKRYKNIFSQLTA